MLGKAANGIADDLLSTIVMVAGLEKTIFCPAMNSDMWANPIVKQNLEKLKENGAEFVDPEYGELACKTVGEGRLAASEKIIAKVKIELLRSNDFLGKHVLITAGPTEEALDPVRYITNASSGKMGFALAEAALSKGASVTLISGPTSLIPLDGISTIFVRSADEMKKAVLDAYPSSDIVIMAAAVSDYKPSHYSKSKIKKSGDKISLQLIKNDDILAELGKDKNNRILVGFAVETDNEIASASDKLRNKNLDMIIVNNPNQEGAAFQFDTNQVTIINRTGEEKNLSLMSKFDVSLYIMDEISALAGLKPQFFESTVQV
jgi:phosphopantothenoylcysteine decarboxylase/phosphopantothenate--cysteine ligase